MSHHSTDQTLLPLTMPSVPFSLLIINQQDGTLTLLRVITHSVAAVICSEAILHWITLAILVEINSKAMLILGQDLILQLPGMQISSDNKALTNLTKDMEEAWTKV